MIWNFIFTSYKPNSKHLISPPVGIRGKCGLNCLCGNLCDEWLQCEWESICYGPLASVFNKMSKWKHIPRTAVVPFGGALRRHCLSSRVMHCTFALQMHCQHSTLDLLLYSFDVELLFTETPSSLDWHVALLTQHRRSVSYIQIFPREYSLYLIIYCAFSYFLILSSIFNKPCVWEQVSELFQLCYQKQVKITVKMWQV